MVIYVCTRLRLPGAHIVVFKSNNYCLGGSYEHLSPSYATRSVHVVMSGRLSVDYTYICTVMERNTCTLRIFTGLVIEKKETDWGGIEWLVRSTSLKCLTFETIFFFLAKIVITLKVSTLCVRH